MDRILLMDTHMLKCEKVHHETQHQNRSESGTPPP